MFPGIGWGLPSRAFFSWRWHSIARRNCSAVPGFVEYFVLIGVLLDLRDRLGDREPYSCRCPEPWASRMKCRRPRPRVRVEILPKQFNARRTPSLGRRSSGSFTFRGRSESSEQNGRRPTCWRIFGGRFSEPNAYEVPYEEIVWLAREPSLALAAWQEALRRVGVQRLEIYGHMLALASQRNPAVREALRKLA